MDTRREFIKKAGLLSGMAGIHALIPESIQKAVSINPVPGSTWMDAEHVVILMQENRSFDHCYGALQGVRGFNDPRAIQLPNGRPVWLQSNAADQTFAPFHLDIKNTKSTWMSSLPHSWSNQVNARNDGRYDQWLPQKRNSIKEYADMPLTLGYYNRQDIPFYYALADAFTVCDQHFCSALTGTNPNRLFYWTGTVRPEQHEHSKAHVWNEDCDYGSLHWKTFPEILEDHAVSWKFYQNEVSIDVGFKGDQDPWLSNYQDNPLEFFSQYNVRLHGKHLAQVRRLIDTLPEEIGTLQNKLVNLPATDPGRQEIQKTIAEKQKELDAAIKEIQTFNQEKFDSLSSRDKNLHRKGFVTNLNDPDFHNLEEIKYEQDGVARKFNVPKGDLLYQFREDVKTGNLPTVSWLAAPERLSDHPSSAWYGAWYVSEVMDILTQNPEVWKKTIFILTYDENDGYFDHIPPFVAPHSEKPETGKASGGLDTRVEYVTVQQEKERNGFPVPYDRASPIGLGFRVPLVVASPWSRGGFVNSEVFDHTSTLQFLETFLSLKKNKTIKSDTISDWRRAVCGDLTSIFRNTVDTAPVALGFPAKEVFLESIYDAKFKGVPGDYKALSEEEIIEFTKDPYGSAFMPRQEKGIKPSNGLFYQLSANGIWNSGKKTFDIRFEAGNKIFGTKSLGSPFNVYAPGKYLQGEPGSTGFQNLKTWAFAVKAGDHLEANWPGTDFENNIYHLRVYGPNGFFREFRGNEQDPPIEISCDYVTTGKDNARLTGDIRFVFTIPPGIPHPIQIVIRDNAYKHPPIQKIVSSKSGTIQKIDLPLDLTKQFGWYDFSVQAAGYDQYEQRFAGRVDTGEAGYSDPYMGRLI